MLALVARPTLRNLRGPVLDLLRDAVGRHIAHTALGHPVAGLRALAVADIVAVEVQ